MTKLLCVFVCVFLLSLTAAAVDLYVDMQKIETDTPPVIEDGRTLVPLRAIFEALDAQVTWEDESKTATGTKGELCVVIRIDDTTAYINEQAYTLDVPAKIVNGRTMVPARFIAEALACRVSWHAETKTVAVADETRDLKLYATPTGKRYHTSDSCNGGSYYETNQAEILGRGLTPCEKCAG